mmetsp:Transcript_8160/g.20461  ORF Transcript_8160/g.20461 Transcript_8160/m.20461 type:complete len:240 (-) Transcript_8160:730-1449(-)
MSSRSKSAFLSALTLQTKPCFWSTLRHSILVRTLLSPISEPKVSKAIFMDGNFCSSCFRNSIMRAMPLTGPPFAGFGPPERVTPTALPPLVETAVALLPNSMPHVAGRLREPSTESPVLKRKRLGVAVFDVVWLELSSKCGCADADSADCSSCDVRDGRVFAFLKERRPASPHVDPAASALGDAVGTGVLGKMSSSTADVDSSSGRYSTFRSHVSFLALRLLARSALLIGDCGMKAGWE